MSKAARMLTEAGEPVEVLSDPTASPYATAERTGPDAGPGLCVTRTKSILNGSDHGMPRARRRMD